MEEEKLFTYPIYCSLLSLFRGTREIFPYWLIVSSFSLNFPMLLVFRGLVGLMTGGTMTGVVLLMEYLPKHTRGLSVIILLVFWALGVLFESVLAFLILPNLSWRYLFGISSVPVFLIILILPWIPESARYLLSKKETELAHVCVLTLLAHLSQS
jgi:MFS family permease